MLHEVDLILTLTGALTAALFFGLLAQKMRLSPIVGYLAAGIAVGPFTPGFVAHGAIAGQFAELGVILLLFGVGLNLHLQELIAVRRVAIPGAILAMAGSSLGGWFVAKMFGWNVASSVVYGLALSIASTVVVLRVFADAGLLHAQVGHVALGWLLVEDLFVVLVLVLLPIFVKTSEHAQPKELVVPIAVTVAKVAFLVVFTLVAGRWVIPRVLTVIARTHSRELFTLAVLAIALGVAVGAAKFFGASMALGAFLAGLVVGQSDFASRAASEALPMRDAFAVLFFVATGMLLDPSHVASNLPLSACTLVVILLVKPCVAFATALLFRYPIQLAFSLGLGLAQVGEFSFMVAGLGDRLGVLPKEATQALVMSSLVAITLNPLLVRLAGPLSRMVEPRRGTSRATPEHKRSIQPGYRTVVVGYGPIGRNLVRLLLDHGLEPTVVEVNHETFEHVRAQGIRAVHGDASRREILERAGISGAGSFIFTSSASSDAAIRGARDLNPHLLILARAQYLREAASLRKAGASDVVSAEGEVALAMVERLLRQFGATAEQLDRARDRVRQEVRQISNDTSEESRP